MWLCADLLHLFASGYVGLQVFRNSFIVISTDDDEPLHSSFVRILVWSLWVGAIWIAGALVPDDLRFTVWALALLADYAGPLLGFWTPTLGRTEVGEWEIDPAHFAERCHLFVIICLGESIVRTGVTAAGLELTAARLGAVFVAFLITTILWWLYFDEVAQRSTKDLHEADEHQGRLARDAYTYLHIPIIPGVVVNAVGDELVIIHPTQALGRAEMLAVVGGPILYLVGHNAFRLRMIGSTWRARMVAAALIALTGWLGSSPRCARDLGGVAAILIPVVVVETRARVRGAALIS